MWLWQTVVRDFFSPYIDLRHPILGIFGDLGNTKARAELFLGLLLLSEDLCGFVPWPFCFCSPDLPPCLFFFNLLLARLALAGLLIFPSLLEESSVFFL